ncbi:polysaccharide lyase 6 family protein [Hufsiella ginkgonis]|uniref:Lyase n=1 Tax=Hufsiella ginkgonis TaxID=2695274 RepID=A0A7K1XVI6_9SPHI|nr:polysaccharide lyase 6 family protein [Hufsiella ginkgonis]MXV14990.1 hypothetical protein [Hufsiella ginkgonis]
MRKTPFHYNLSIIFCLLLIITRYTSQAATTRVSSLAGLQKAIQNAKPGDNIVLASGSYPAAADIAVTVQGTKGNPITISSEKTGTAIIDGKGGFNLGGNASYIVIRGFKFIHASSRAASGPETSFCRWTQNSFQNAGPGENLTIAGNNHEIDHNTFQDKDAMGRFLAIRGKGVQIAQNLWIHHNYFVNYAGQGGANGAEALQFGLSGFSMSISNSVVEYNLFEKCAGEAELISVKAGGVTLRYNTIRDCPAQFTLRHGNRNEVYGNYFYRTPGLRIFGDDHRVYSNYFENCIPAITIGNGDGEVADGAKLTVHDRPDRVLIAFNTLINSKQGIVLPARKDGMGATLITIARNIISGGEVAVAIQGELKGGKWQDNLVFNAKDAGNIPVTGYQTTYPMLVRSPAETSAFHLQGSSLAIDDTPVNAYPMVTVDMDGQKRTGKFDTGADEWSTGKVTASPLYADKVGAW